MQAFAKVSDQRVAKKLRRYIALVLIGFDNQLSELRLIIIY